MLRREVVSRLKGFYKTSFLKEYNKAGLVLRLEVCVNDPRDFTMAKSLVHLDYLGTAAYHALMRLQKAQAVAVATAVDRSTFERLVTPSEHGGQRVAGLRFGAPRTMRLVAALGCAGLTFKAFSQAELRAVLVDRLGVPPTECTPAQLAYDLRKLRGKGGVIRKTPGYRVAGYWTKLHQQLLTPTLDSLEAALRPAVAASAHPLDHALTRLDASFDDLAELTGLKFAA